MSDRLSPCRIRGHAGKHLWPEQRPHEEVHEDDFLDAQVQEQAAVGAALPPAR